MYFMGKFLTSYFYYSRSERNGVVLLAALSFGVLMFTKIYSFMNRPSNTIADFTAFEQEIAAFTSQQASDTEGGTSGAQNEEAVLFAFNPNDATKDDFMRLGLSPKVATTLVHYREKGGRFFKKEDLKKIYGLKPTDYARLESYIELENNGGFAKRNFGNTPQYKDAKKTPHAIELKPFDPNTASEDDLLGLGLDEKSVKILLKYREKGGHFKTKEDLRKVYGLSDIDFLRIQSYIQIADNQFVAKNAPTTTQNSGLPKKIDNTGTVTVELNSANLEELVQIRGRAVAVDEVGVVGDVRDYAGTALLDFIAPLGFHRPGELHEVQALAGERSPRCAQGFHGSRRGVEIRRVQVDDIHLVGGRNIRLRGGCLGGCHGRFQNLEAAVVGDEPRAAGDELLGALRVGDAEFGGDVLSRRTDECDGEDENCQRPGGRCAAAESCVHSW